MDKRCQLLQRRLVSLAPSEKQSRYVICQRNGAPPLSGTLTAVLPWWPPLMPTLGNHPSSVRTRVDRTRMVQYDVKTAGTIGFEEARVQL